jgi:uncharacterized membrane protein YgcG
VGAGAAADQLTGGATGAIAPITDPRPAQSRAPRRHLGDAARGAVADVVAPIADAAAGAVADVVSPIADPLGGAVADVVSPIAERAGGAVAMFGALTPVAEAAGGRGLLTWRRPSRSGRRGGRRGHGGGVSRGSRDRARE